MNQLLRTMKLESKLAPSVLLLCLCGLTLPAEGAENSEQAQQELESVGSAIREIRSWLSDARSTQSEELENLQQADLQISEISQSITETETALATTESEIAELSQQADRLNTDKELQSEILQQAIRTVYMAGNQSAIELLLNQQDLSSSARMLHYHRLFTEAQLDSITAFQETLNNLATIEQQLDVKVSELEAEQLTLSSSLENLNASKQNRELALSQLREEIASRSSQLEQLEMDQAQLQELIEQINRAVADIPAAMQRAPFAAQRGKLPMPLAGEIINRFGSRLGESDLTRQGITIGASEGTPVQAIHPGRVVFSDWLRGTGLLVILDHGEGYMSLYGANQALSKQAGDWVNAGDIIATSGMANELSGSSGASQPRPGMYFEIRHHGEAQNPSRWLSD
jgi:murein hydrolase activator